MNSVRLDCGHCNREVDFHLYQPEQLLSVAPPDLGKSNGNRLISSPALKVGNAAELFDTCICPLCKTPSLIFFRGVPDMIGNSHTHFSHISLLHQHPTPPEPATSPYYPDKIRKSFARAQKYVADPEAAPEVVGMCRSVLDVSLKELGINQKLLINGIKEAHNQGSITKGIADWSHRVRIEGNEALHEIEANQEEALELIEFIKIFLEVVFVLPAKIQNFQDQP